MERLNYSEIVMQIVKEHYQYHTQDSQYETQLILDSERNHYLLISLRWQNEQRDYGCSIHVDIDILPTLRIARQRRILQS
ncbi:MAG: hypothetical protein F6K54_37455 [Okeania sp. SIO3B5]|uniref:element excision factor XisI family protein n=1 Tax=Okeania sp. SIO3B5 TaxID=2607811 RepID=UPI0013FED11D|nr:element excision factor XisI family protein [Okeania sp. SIO3B5]NEO58246.1 hypothetical protein [Okeania sp. SIO3B5]